MRCSFDRRIGVLAVGAPLLAAGCFAVLDFDGYRQPDGPSSGDLHSAGQGPPDSASSARDVETPTLHLGALPPLRLRRGASASLAITITRSGAVGPVALSARGASFSSADLTIPANATTAQLVVTVTAEAELGDTTLVVAATADGLVESSNVPVTVFASTIDPSFGDGGVVLVPGTIDDVAADGDGGAFLVRDNASFWFVDNVANDRIQLVRRTGVSGVHHVAVGSDGTFAIAGESLDQSAVTISRYAWNKELWNTPFTPYGEGRRIVAGDGGYLLVAGIETKGEASGERIGLAEVDRDGDGGFDSSLVALTNDGHISSPSAVDAVAMDDGVVVCTTEDDIPAKARALGLRRIRSDGTLDPAFGNNGLVLLELPFRSLSCRGLARSGDRLVAVGLLQPADGQTDTRVVLFSTDLAGARRADFGDAGVIMDPRANIDVGGVAVDPSGKIYVAGADPADVRGFVRGVVFGYNADGTPDPGFGDARHGTAVGMPFDEASKMNLVRVLSDGHILVGGTTVTAGPYLMRVQP